MPTWMPPAADVQSALTQAVVPAFGAAAGVYGLLVALKRNAEVAAALAFIVGLFTANYFRGTITPEFTGAFPYFQLPERRIDWLLYLAAFTATAGVAIRRKSISTPLAVGLLAAVGIFACTKVGAVPAWFGAAAFGLIAAAFAGLGADTARHTPFLFAIALNTSAVLALTAHSARLCDLGTIGFAAVAGLGIVGWIFKQAATAPLFGATLLLAAVCLMAQQDTYSDVPWYAFVLPAAAPCLAVLLPDRWPVARFAVTLFGCGAAVAVAQFHEPFDFSGLG